MKYFQTKIRTNIITLCFIITTTIVLAACESTKVASYDDTLYIETMNAGIEVEGFYQQLLEEEPGSRVFQPYANKYQIIEKKLHTLYSKNMARKYNHESTKISKLTLNLWRKYKITHKTKNTYSNSKIKFDNDRFKRLFSSAASAENFKRGSE